MPYLGNTAGNRFVASKAATQFSGDGSTTAFTLDHAVGSDEDILVSVDGVIQEPSVAYAVSNGTTLTFTGAPSNNSGNNIFVYYLFRTVGTVDHPSTSALSATSGTFSGAVTAASLAADGGITVDNITIDATEIDLSSGSFTIDSAANITLDCGTGEFLFNNGDNGNLLKIQGDSSNVNLITMVQDKDLVFKGNDGGSTITALTLDMSEGGQATFNSSIVVGGTVSINSSNCSAFAQAGDDVFQFGTSTNDDLQFYTNNTERMRIRSGGFVAINTTGGSAQFQVLASSGDIVYFQNSSGTGAKLTAGNQSFSAVSDENKKENIVELDKQESYDNIKKIRAITYKFKDMEVTDDNGKKTTYKDDKSRIGFIAQDWETKYSQLVNTDDDGVKSLLYTETTPVLLSALQKAQEKIEELEARITALESK